MTLKETWVAVPLRDGQVLEGMLVLRDEERVVLRHAYWVYSAMPDPIIEYLPCERPWQAYVEVDNSEVVIVSERADDYWQKYDIVSWPPRKRVQSSRWVGIKKAPSTMVAPPKHPTFDPVEWFRAKRALEAAEPASA